MHVIYIYMYIMCDIKLRPYINISSTIHMYSGKLAPGIPMVIYSRTEHEGGSDGAYKEIFGAGSELF
jgi:hypothetical protein